MLYTEPVRQAQADMFCSAKPIIHLCTYDRSDFFAVCKGAFFRLEEDAQAPKDGFVDLMKNPGEPKAYFDRKCVLYAMTDGEGAAGEKLWAWLSAYVDALALCGGRAACRVVLGGAALQPPRALASYVRTICIGPLQPEDFRRLLKNGGAADGELQAAIDKAAEYYARELTVYTQDEVRMLLGEIETEAGKEADRYPLLNLNCAQEVIRRKKPELLQSRGLIQVTPEEENVLDPESEEAKWLKPYVDGSDRRGFGVMLVGLPGTGKSMTAEGIARLLNVPLVRLNMTDVKDKWVGESGKNFRSVLDNVRRFGRCILNIEEIDLVLSGSASSAQGNGVMPNILQQLLEFLEHPGEVITVATSNDLSSLKHALIRPRRFAVRFARMLPAYHELRRILCSKLSFYLGISGEAKIDGECVADYFLKKAAHIGEVDEYQFLTGSDVYQLVAENLDLCLPRDGRDRFAGERLEAQAQAALKTCIDEATENFVAAYRLKAYEKLEMAARSYISIFGESVIMGGLGGGVLSRENYDPRPVLAAATEADAAQLSCMKPVKDFATDYDRVMYEEISALMTQCLRRRR